MKCNMQETFTNISRFTGKSVKNFSLVTISITTAHTHSVWTGCQRQAESSVQSRRRNSLWKSEFEGLQ